MRCDDYRDKLRMTSSAITGTDEGTAPKPGDHSSAKG
ncbi:Uncharacterised protein [Mycobacteroides abscessus subsp. abscessus]|nr:Uncharacterised protein [Mycobacteroides abscessus subsp. abscessus]